MSAAHDNNETEDFRPRGWVQVLFRGSRDPRYRLVVWCFAVGSLSHLWLADAWQWDWLPANVVYAVGVAILLVSGGSIGWIACAVGLAIPLLFLRDQLTQSVFLLAVSVAGAGFIIADAPRRKIDSFLWCLRGLTIALYAIAVFHKLNAQFLDPATSCANYGMAKLFRYYQLDPAAFGWLEPAHPWIALGFELAIPLAYLLGRSHVARIVAIVFHIPLTLTMAPAFAFVMMTGHAAFVTDEERRALWDGLRRHARWLAVAAVSTTAVSLAAHGAIPEPLMIPREALLWLMLFWFAVVRPPRPRRGRSGRSAPGIVIVGAFLLNGATPYLGVQYQHTGAMLSNLRIDEGCWNHVLVGEWARLTDDYVRVEEVHFREPGHVEEYERIVLDQLWSPPQIRQMRRNWCRPEVRPFTMRGTFRDREWRITDLCDQEEAWPFTDDGLLGVEVFGDFLRYQKNLQRECPQECIH